MRRSVYNSWFSIIYIDFIGIETRIQTYSLKVWGNQIKLGRLLNLVIKMSPMFLNKIHFKNYSEYLHLNIGCLRFDCIIWCCWYFLFPTVFSFLFSRWNWAGNWRHFRTVGFYNVCMNCSTVWTAGWIRFVRVSTVYNTCLVYMNARCTSHPDCQSERSQKFQQAKTILNSV